MSWDFDMLELELDLVSQCEANHELDKLNPPETAIELFDAWDRANEDRIKLIEEIKKLRELKQLPAQSGHAIVAWPERSHQWKPEFCWSRQSQCFCAWSYYYYDRG